MPNSSIASPIPRLQIIDGLRGLAILMVLAQHTLDHSIKVPDNPSELSAFLHLIICGMYGVQLFFVVSAFTLYNSAKTRFAEEPNPIHSFYLRRFFRVVPFWWMATFVYAVVVQPWTSALVATLFFYFGIFRPWHALDVFDVQWSMFVEETFYLFLPWILSYLTRPRNALILVAVTYPLAMAWTLAGAHWGLNPVLVYQYPLNHWYGFGLGILAAMLFNDRPAKRRWLSSTLHGWAWSLVVVVVLGSMLYLPAGLLKHTLANVAIFSLLCGTLIDGSPLQRLARSRLLGRFGICCYSIYLFHLLIAYYAFPWQRPLFSILGTAPSRELRFFLLFPILALVNLAIGSITFHFIERPSIEFGKQVIKRWNEKNRSLLKAYP